jgi:hypothetical protein
MTGLSARVVHDLVVAGEESLKSSALSAGELGFVSRTLISACLPRSKMDTSHYSIANGQLRFSMIAPPEIGLPYGAKARLIVLFLVTEAVRTKHRDVVLGQSLTDFMRRLGLNATGGTNGSIHHLKNQMVRLFSTTINISWADERAIAISNSNIVQSAQLWWSNERATLGQNGGCIRLGEEFFNDTISRPVPVDLRAVRALKRSALALDIYSWLTYRMSYLSSGHAHVISWQALALQFGIGYSPCPQGLINFRLRFSEQMEKVLLVYPQASVLLSKKGVLLNPSPSHVARRSRNLSTHNLKDFYA